MPLLSRTTRSVRVTREGETFLNRAKRALAELDAAAFDLRDQAALQRGRVVVTCVPTIASSIIPHILASFCHRFPAIAVNVIDEASHFGIERVLNRGADIGVGPSTEQHKDLVFAPLARDHFVAVLPRSHALAKRRNVRLNDLIRYPLLMLPSGTNVHELVRKAFKVKGFEIKPAFELSHHSVLGEMVEVGLGITILPSMALRMVSHPRLRTIPIIDPAITREIGIFQRRDTATAPATAQFLKTLRESFSTLMSGQKGKPGKQVMPNR